MEFLGPIRGTRDRGSFGSPSRSPGNSVFVVVPKARNAHGLGWNFPRIDDARGAAAFEEPPRCTVVMASMFVGAIGLLLVAATDFTVPSECREHFFCSGSLRWRAG